MALREASALPEVAGRELLGRAMPSTSLSRGGAGGIEEVSILTLPGIALIGDHHAAKRDGSCDDAERI
jgi:hypothetical protein